MAPDVLVLSPPPRRTFVQRGVSLAATIGVVLLIPLMIIGLPLALVWRAILALVRWPRLTVPAGREFGP